MSTDYSIPLCKSLEKEFQDCQLHRPMVTDRYDEGDKLSYDAISISGKESGHIDLEIEKFVGGGFAGQVYKVKISDIIGDQIEGLSVGSFYALKILIPPLQRISLFS